MNTLLHSLELAPLWGLVSIRDMGTDDYPQSADGDYECLAGRGQIYVSTRTDSEGDVRVRVYLGKADPAVMRVIHEGVMEFKSGIISITAPAMEDEETVILPAAGVWQVGVAVSGGGSPDSVDVYLSSVS
ncbi:hypothetical protein ACFVFS_22090 [Kitasatospora sp. NPDC057692]|uniref:hypothetical protein n=1 Tax=Kitasatospora sp. NPDC057692 TaxID=3346215 RepID=UPI0036AE755E